jgi:hypothetical protein
MNRYSVCSIASVAITWSVATTAQAQQPVLPTITKTFATVCTTATAVDGAFFCQDGDRVLAVVTPGPAVDGSPFSQGYTATIVSDFTAECQELGREQNHFDGIQPVCGIFEVVAVQGEGGNGWLPISDGTVAVPFGEPLEEGSLQLTWPDHVQTVQAISGIESVICGCNQTSDNQTTP